MYKINLKILEKGSLIGTILSHSAAAYDTLYIFQVGKSPNAASSLSVFMN